MKKMILYSFILMMMFLIALLLGAFGILFFRPNWIISPKNLDYVLKKSHVLKSWSWQEASFDLAWDKWNRRIAKGHFENLCFHYVGNSIDYETCIEKISWNFEINYQWKMEFSSRTLEPFFIRSSLTNLTVNSGKESKTKSAPPDVWKYWKIFWSKVIPDMDVKLDNIHLTANSLKHDFYLHVIKRPQHLNAESMHFKLTATPDDFVLQAPKKYPFPKKIEFLPQMYFHNVQLEGKVTKKGIPLHLSGALEMIDLSADTFIKLPLKKDLNAVKFLEKSLLNAKAVIEIPDIKRSLGRLAPEPYRELPAPINAMDGGIKITINCEKTKEPNVVVIKSLGAVRMKGGKQVLNMDITSEVPLHLIQFKPGEIIFGFDFHQVALQLPRLSKKATIPQFLPDKRFKKGPYKKNRPEKSKVKFAMHLEALGEKAMGIKTSLLDELLRFNFDLFIQEGELHNGYISFLPLKTSIFRRPIHVKKLRVNFDYPKDPVLISTIKFPLPEYKITLNVEGPIRKPRYHFSSEPPLSTNDIYSVLLFGRPMEDLDQTDKTSAQKTNQILAEGLISLSTLYFFAGSRVEYVGYDPNARKATAQFGLDSKTSLSVGRDQEGVNSSGIRRSLGKGWYLDTTVQGPSSSSSSNQKTYGVILERVLSY